MDNGIAIEDLTDATLDEAAHLLADYACPDGWEPDHLPTCRANLERLLAWPGARLLLARRNRVPAGFVALHWGFSTTKGLPVLHIQDLYTAPAHQRTGVAQALLRRAAELAGEHGANRLQLNTDEGNVAARALYERQGFLLFPRKRVYMRFL